MMRSAALPSPAGTICQKRHFSEQPNPADPLERVLLSLWDRLREEAHSRSEVWVSQTTDGGSPWFWESWGVLLAQGVQHWPGALQSSSTKLGSWDKRKTLQISDLAWLSARSEAAITSAHLQPLS